MYYSAIFPNFSWNQTHYWLKYDLHTLANWNNKLYPSLISKISLFTGKSKFIRNAQEKWRNQNSQNLFRKEIWLILANFSLIAKMMENFRVELPKFSWKGQQGKYNIVVNISIKFSIFKSWSVIYLIICMKVKHKLFRKENIDYGSKIKSMFRFLIFHTTEVSFLVYCQLVPRN